MGPPLPAPEPQEDPHPSPFFLVPPTKTPALQGRGWGLQALERGLCTPRGRGPPTWVLWGGRDPLPPFQPPAGGSSRTSSPPPWDPQVCRWLPGARAAVLTLPVSTEQTPAPAPSAPPRGLSPPRTCPPPLGGDRGPPSPGGAARSIPSQGATPPRPLRSSPAPQTMVLRVLAWGRIWGCRGGARPPAAPPRALKATHLPGAGAGGPWVLLSSPLFRPPLVPLPPLPPPASFKRSLFSMD